MCSLFGFSSKLSFFPPILRFACLKTLFAPPPPPSIHETISLSTSNLLQHSHPNLALLIHWGEAKSKHTLNLRSIVHFLVANTCLNDNQTPEEDHDPFNTWQTISIVLNICCIYDHWYDNYIFGDDPQFWVVEVQKALAQDGINRAVRQISLR